MLFFLKKVLHFKVSSYQKESIAINRKFYQFKRKSLKEECTAADIFVITSSVCENCYCHIPSPDDKLLPRYHEKQFQRQLTISPHQQTLLYNAYGRKIFHIFLKRNMLLTNVLFINNFIKRYRTSYVINKIIRDLQFCKEEPICFTDAWGSLQTLWLN